jgi:hypothetical protein
VLGPPCTDGGADRGGPGHGGALSGARPPATPVHQSSPVGAQKGERSTGSSAWASPELGRRCGGWAMVVRNQEAAALGEDTAQVWRERKRSGGRCGATQGWCSPFIGAGGAPGRGGRGGLSFTNVISSDVVHALYFCTWRLPTPLYMQWMNTSGTLKLTHKARVKFSVGT